MALRPTGARVGLTSTSSARKQTRPRRKSPRPRKPRELREARIAPSKALGQHFLTDYTVVNRIVDAAELTRTDVVIEIGPGLGVLTERLVDVARRVIAVELDERLGDRLREKLGANSNLTIVHDDVLKTPLEVLLGAAGLGADTPYVVVANLPYNIGAAVLRHFLEATHPPRFLIVMLQREVAASVAAGPGDLSIVGVSVQVYARARRLFSVPPRAFYPPPKVTSAVIRLDLRTEPLITPAERQRFFRVLRAGFSAPRKQIRNTLAQGLGIRPHDAAAALEEARIDPSLRPQQLALEDWLRLAKQVEA